MLLSIVALCLAITGRAAADGPFLLFNGCRWSFPNLCKEWRERCCCPDDYHPKDLPCVEPNPKGRCDDYCRKCLPSVPPVDKGCCDDYCPKCCPIFLWKPCEPWYTCGPPEMCAPCQPR